MRSNGSSLSCPAVPRISYPEQLPVSQRKDEILAAIRDHQVVIVAGETGSGKTTQLPKICLELGRGIRGTIGHTQPRRLAARTVAERIAEELATPLGDSIGYKVRFTDQVSDGTLVKLMTDGILLAEIQSDRMLSQYDTLIIDEAHERSLNIDFILGYVKQLLPRRPDLKVVITSATIDPERFSRHFGDAPIVEVSGRTYPVEVRYRPIVDPDDPNADEDRDQTQAIIDAVRELSAE
ncbi:DEAD/DEAH box helicase, partial [Kibdelosporangium lantanae]